MSRISPRVRPNVTRPYYHAPVVYVRQDGAGDEAVVAVDPASLGDGGASAEGPTGPARADWLVSAAPEGPFEPLPVALERDARLLDAFTRALPVPSLTAWSRVRYAVLAAAVVPLALTLDLDRGLLTRSAHGAGRLVLDLITFVFVAVELGRRVPRRPGFAAAALVAVAMRWALVATQACGRNVGVKVWLAAGLALASAIVILVRAPARARTALELLGKLGIAKGDALEAARRPPLPVTTVVASAAATAALPAMLFAARRAQMSLSAQAILAVVYAGAALFVVRRLTALAATKPRDASPPHLDPSRTPPLTERLKRHAPEIGLALAGGLALTAAAVYGSHAFFQAGDELARCASKLDAESKRAIAAEAAGLTKRLAEARGSLLVAFIAVVVTPFVEERLFRGLLQETLTQRYGRLYAIFASSFAFGLTHIGVYEAGLYQTFLLGVALGLTYAEGGLFASTFVHALFALLVLL